MGVGDVILGALVAIFFFAVGILLINWLTPYAIPEILMMFAWIVVSPALVVAVGIIILACLGIALAVIFD